MLDSALLQIILAGIYLFKVNNGKTTVMCEITLKLTLETIELRQRRRCGFFIVKVGQV